MKQPRYIMMTVLVLLLALPTISIGQQLGQFSQYMQNMYVLNPAVAGLYNQTEISLGYRDQWTGIDDSPRQFYLSGTLPIARKAKKRNFQASSTRISRPTTFQQAEPTKKVFHGIGGLASSQEIGAFSRTIANVSYAVHVPMTEKFTVGFGTSAGVAIHSFDQAKISNSIGSDQAFINFTSGQNNTNVLDLNIGLMGYSDKWYVGYSSAQVLQSELDFGGSSAMSGTKLNMHHFVVAGYTYAIDAKYSLKPSILIKYMDPTPTTADVNLKLVYQEKYWGGISYRHSSALVALLGIQVNEKVKIGYTYDYSISKVRSIVSGSHEFYLGIVFNKKETLVF